MDLVAALVILAQAAGMPTSLPSSGTAAGTSAATARPMATATASARVLRPVSVRLDPRTGALTVTHESAAMPQRQRDAAGTVWIEFS